GTGGAVDVSFIVVYSVQNPNAGQPVGASYTGPVICRGSAPRLTTFEKDGTTPLAETSVIPADTDPGGATSVDVLSSQEQLLLQYKLNGGSNGGDNAIRVCGTTKDGTTCAQIDDVVFSPGPG